MGKSRRGRRFSILAIVFTAALSSSAAAQSDWVPVSAADNTFHFMAPVAPTVNTSEAKEGDTPYTITTFISVSNGFAVIGAYTVYHAADAEADPDLVLGGFLKGLQAELVSSTPMPYQRAPGDSLKGLMASAKNDNVTCHIRVAVEDVRIYTLAACGSKGIDTTADMDRAIGSFSITKP